jgi:NADPH-dependent glutamate synthase beta subunit-like oxidoreductase
LFKDADAGVKIDMFERLPTPFGLVRAGVAPDHPEVKNVIHEFDKVVGDTKGRFRYFGNVTIGNDLSLEHLSQQYDAVVFCTGAEGEQRLGIAGEDLSGVVDAQHFCKWYNGHPEHTQLHPDPGSNVGEAAMVIGQGNVALDVARILCKSPDELHATDIADHAIDVFKRWQKDLRTVHVVGRRGFAQAAFTNKEVRELTNCSEHILPVVDPMELELCMDSESQKIVQKERPKKRQLEILKKMADNFAKRDSTSKRVIQLHFLQSPVEILGSGDPPQAMGVRLQRMELQGDVGAQRAVPAASGEQCTLHCGLVIRSIGFGMSVPEGLPKDHRGKVPQQEGRVSLPENHSLPKENLYVCGWLKRGPTGVILASITDAQEVASRILTDLRGLKHSTHIPEVEAMLGTKQIVSFDDWRRLEKEEASRGASTGKVAAKITNVDEMLQLVKM